MFTCVETSIEIGNSDSTKATNTVFKMLSSDLDICTHSEIHEHLNTCHTSSIINYMSTINIRLEWA